VSEELEASHHEVSLRIWHPEVTPERISQELDLPMTAGWAVGAPRSGLGGTALTPHESSYWTSTFRSRESNDLVADIRDLSRYLESRLSFLREIRATGGRVEYFIGWFIDRHSGNTFNSADLAVLCHLDVDLAIDVYGTAPTPGDATAAPPP
jgi:hypothetical protein